MRNKWLLYLVLFMLAANAALVTTMLLKDSGFVTKNSEVNNNFRRKSGLKFEKHLAKELGFNQEQMQKIKVFSNEFHVNQKASRNELFSLRDAYFKALSQANPDTLVLHNIERKIADIEVIKLKEEYMHYRNVRSVCNKEQAIKMDSLGRMHMHHKFNKTDSEGKCRQSHSNHPQTNKNCNNYEKQKN